ncbi:MAG: methyltransferase domain-containing protein [Nitrososphaeraceae archaeon]
MNGPSNSQMNQNSIDPKNLQKFMEVVMSDLGGAYSAVLVYIGDKLGLYKAMKDAGTPITSHELAARTKTSERNIREWLANQAAGGYVIYDSQAQKYSLPMENALALADEDSPVYAVGAFQATMSFFKDASKIIEAFRTGKGLSWGEHDPDLFLGTERFFKPGYRANLVSSWIPSLDNGRVEEKLNNKAVVADVGCGHGVSTIIMAKAYPNSKFIGFDNHQDSIKRARELARAEGLNKNQIRFEVSSATDYPHYPQNGEQYDLIAFFDSLHDMGDPVCASFHALKSLKPDGTIMIVEPFANDKTEDNLNPLGRLFYAASAMSCVPGSMAFNGPALGAQAGEAKIGEVVKAGGFKQFRRATQTQFNIIYEARP